MPEGHPRTRQARNAPEDSRFADTAAGRENMDEIVRIISETFITRARDEWLDVLRAGPDFIVGPVNSIDDLPADPQVTANGYIVDVEHPALGGVKMVGLPFSIDRTPVPVRRVAPEFGQHTEEVLTELLGYGWDHVERLKDERVI